jgi:glycosyltransferase involved in cell wall biosynthesis
MKTIFLMDTYVGGHHLMYLRCIGKTLLELGYQVIIFYPEPHQVADWLNVQCPNQFHKCKTLPIQEPAVARLPLLGRLPQPFNVLARWQRAATVAKTAASALGKPPDLVLFNWLDSYLSAYIPRQIVSQIFPYAWAGLCFQPQLPFGVSSPRREGKFNYHEVLNADRCRAVGVLDANMAIALQQQIRCPVVTFPDFTDQSTPDRAFAVAQAIRQQAQGRPIVGLLGSLNKRKGLLTLMEAAISDQSKNWFFAFVGQLSTYTMSPAESDRVQAIVASAPSNCFFHLERIPDEPQFNALVETCDVLFAAYENFPYSSNLLTKAAVFNKPVIASQGVCMGERVEQFQLGVAIAEGNVEQCIAAVQQLCDYTRTSTDSPTFTPDFAGYRQQHSIAQLRVALQEVLAHV